jgi:hypothetical protein
VDDKRALNDLIDCLVASTEAALQIDAPFRRLAFEKVFPNDLYTRMLEAMPVESDYRPMSGRAKVARRDDGSPTRVKIDLFPEYLRHMPPGQRAVWTLVSRGLCSPALRSALAARLADGLERRFGEGFDPRGLYPTPTLTRDTPGYSIHPHPDTRWKAVTVQFYLPRDASIAHVGTVFHDRTPDGGYGRAGQAAFAPNSGYAFAVGTDTWHSVDVVGPEVSTRDSILLTYFTDSSPLTVLRNRGRRLGNFLGNEVRQRAG